MSVNIAVMAVVVMAVVDSQWADTEADTADTEADMEVDHT